MHFVFELIRSTPWFYLHDKPNADEVVDRFLDKKLWCVNVIFRKIYSVMKG